jgi:hypothetical protein
MQKRLVEKVFFNKPYFKDKLGLAEKGKNPLINSICNDFTSDKCKLFYGII